MSKQLKLLTLNSHEAWIYQLSALPAQVDIIDGLPNRYTASWDRRMRPVPDNGRLISLAQAQSTTTPYDCIIAHNITDIMDVKDIPGPRILVLHGMLETRLKDAPGMTAEKIRASLNNYLRLVGGHVIAVSESKRNSWGLDADVIHNGVNCDDYPVWEGNISKGLRVANQITLKHEVLLWEFHQKAFHEIPIKIIGHNPDMQGIHPATDWDDLKKSLQTHRFFVHTADPRLEDGFNMAVLEAMAAGLPVIGNKHPTSLIQHGLNGFQADTPEKLAKYAVQLLEDKELAAKLGAAGKEIIRTTYSLQSFSTKLQQALHTAKEKANATQYFS